MGEYKWDAVIEQLCSYFPLTMNLLHPKSVIDKIAVLSVHMKYANKYMLTVKLNEFYIEI